MLCSANYFMYIWNNKTIADTKAVTLSHKDYIMQTHQGLCAANGRTPTDQAAVVLLPEAEATPVQTGLAGRGPHSWHGSGCPLSLGHCG